jgi:enoyl-CoA hydratase
MTDAVTLETCERISHLRIDDGAVNALSHRLIAAIDDALDRVEADGDARALMISGRRGRFCAGFDLNAMAEDVASRTALVSAGGHLALRLARFPLPLVIAADGHALALGAILLCAADYRVGASGDYRVGMNEVGIGMVVPEFGTALARLRLSRRWFHRAVILGEIMDPESARQAGFLDELAPPGRTLERAADKAAELARYLDRDAFAATRARLYESHLLAVENRLPEDVSALLEARP